VYFVRPTSENLKRIVVDATKKLYRSFNVHFLTRIERPMLEEFAQDLVTANAATNISKIFDEYLDFIAVEPSLFTLNMKNSYVGYNSPALAEVSCPRRPTNQFANSVFYQCYLFLV
jgi:sec1 family domain-containing protein 1